MPAGNVWRTVELKLVRKGWRYSHTYGSHRYYLHGRHAVCRLHKPTGRIVG